MRTMIFVFLTLGGVSWALALATFVLHVRKYNDLADTHMDDRLARKAQTGARAPESPDP